MASPSRTYRNTPTHYKTLDVLASVKKLDRFTVLELENYVCRARDEGHVTDIDGVKSFLNTKFNWDCSSRDDDIRKAYDNVFKPIDVDANTNDDIAGNTNEQIASNENTSLPIIDNSRLPIFIKNNCWSKNILLCQIDDPDMNFTGDLGAIGRLSVEPNNLMIDLKGRQYGGHISQGPTVMLLNLAQQVGLSQKVQQARVEALTNEYCHLKFERDTFGSMTGLYSGSSLPLDDYEDNHIAASDSEDDNDMAANKKIPKISTITNRKRKSQKELKRGARKTLKKSK